MGILVKVYKTHLLDKWQRWINAKSPDGESNKGSYISVALSCTLWLYFFWLMGSREGASFEFFPSDSACSLFPCKPLCLPKSYKHTFISISLHCFADHIYFYLFFLFFLCRRPAFWFSIRVGVLVTNFHFPTYLKGNRSIYWVYSQIPNSIIKTIIINYSQLFCHFLS